MREIIAEKKAAFQAEFEALNKQIGDANSTIQLAQKRQLQLQGAFKALGDLEEQIQKDINDLKAAGSPEVAPEQAESAKTENQGE